MNQILVLMGLIIVAMIALKLMAALASFVLRFGILLALAVAGYVCWQAVSH